MIDLVKYSYWGSAADNRIKLTHTTLLTYHLGDHKHRSDTSLINVISFLSLLLLVTKYLEKKKGFIRLRLGGRGVTTAS